MAEVHHDRLLTVRFDERAPFGELMITPLNSDVFSQHAGGVPGLAYSAINRLFSQAWGESDWLKQLSPEAAENFQDGNLPEGMHESVQAAFLDVYTRQKRVLGFIAVRPSLDNESPRWRERIVGVAFGKHDVSGNPIERWYKPRFKPEKVYANVSDINVRPDQQGHGLGAALLYVSLTNFTPDQVPTTYVPTVNQPLIAKLGEIGYEVTGIRSRTDLIPAVTIEEARLAADTVEQVRERLSQRHSWLQDSEVVASGSA